MGYARYVGRIWALAVALGIGAGLAATPWGGICRAENGQGNGQHDRSSACDKQVAA